MSIYKYWCSFILSKLEWTNSCPLPPPRPDWKYQTRSAPWWLTLYAAHPPVVATGGGGSPRSLQSLDPLRLRYLYPLLRRLLPPGCPQAQLLQHWHPCLTLWSWKVDDEICQIHRLVIHDKPRQWAGVHILNINHILRFDDGHHRQTNFIILTRLSALMF